MDCSSLSFPSGSSNHKAFGFYYILVTLQFNYSPFKKKNFAFLVPYTVRTRVETARKGGHSYSLITLYLSEKVLKAGSWTNENPYVPYVHSHDKSHKEFGGKMVIITIWAFMLLERMSDWKFHEQTVNIGLEIALWPSVCFWFFLYLFQKSRFYLCKRGTVSIYQLPWIWVWTMAWWSSHHWRTFG